MENKEKDLSELLDPYKEDTKTFFAMREEAFQKKRNEHIEKFGNPDDFIKRDSVLRIKKIKKPKKIKPEKLKKPKKVKPVKVKKEKVIKESKYVFKINSWNIKQKLFITASLLLAAVSFASFVDAYGFKFIIFYNNGIDMDNRLAAFFMYASIMSLIAYLAIGLFKAKKIIINNDGAVFIKTVNVTLKTSVVDAKIEIIKNDKTFNFTINGKEVKSIKNKYLDSFESATSQTPLNSQKMV